MININVSKHAAIASSAACCISGLSIIGSRSFGMALEAGRDHVPNPATWKTAFRTFDIILGNLLHLELTDQVSFQQDN